MNEDRRINMIHRSMFKICFAMTVLGCASICVLTQERVKLLPVKVNSVWGFIDRDGEVVIRPRFFSASEFSQGLAAVSLAGTEIKCGYIDGRGETVVPIRFDYCGPYAEGLAVVRLDKKYGFIDSTGQWVIPLTWDMAWPFSEGLARVAKGNYDSARYGFIDLKGKVVIKPVFLYAGDFRDKRAQAAVGRSNGLELGFIDENGKWVIKPRYGSANAFSEGLACVVQEGVSYLLDGQLALETDDEFLKAYYIDISGQRAFKGFFNQCGGFSNGSAPVVVNDKWAYINKQGEVILRTNFSSSAQLSPFSEGLAAVNFAGKAKFINSEGKVELETTFDWADNFVDGIARVKTVTLNGKDSIGYIDKKGQAIWMPSS